MLTLLVGRVLGRSCHNDSNLPLIITLHFPHYLSLADPSERGLYYLFYSYSELAGGAVLAALVAGETISVHVGGEDQQASGFTTQPTKLDSQVSHINLKLVGILKKITHAPLLPPLFRRGGGKV